MRETPAQAVADQRRSEAKPYPAWAEIMKRLGAVRHAPPAGAQAGREWQDLVADLIVGRPHT